ALADLDGDGQLDLFVGGRCLLGKYPQAASSMMFHNAAGKFEVDAANTKALTGVGMVSAAVFSDLDGDGFPELILACEWGPIKIFKNDRGRLREVTVEWGIAKYTGWWNGVTAGDLNNDGRMDIIASNWGLNTKYRASNQHPRKIYYGDFVESGRVDTIEAYFDDEMGKEAPERELDAMAASLPFLRGMFPTHRAYGAAGISELLGDHLKIT